MPELNEDLWPSDLGIASTIVTPAAILRTQATLLGEKTKGILEAAVETFSANNDIYHRFVIKVPALGNYRYTLFQVHHPVTLYPVVVDQEPTMPITIANLMIDPGILRITALPDEDDLR
ncbi:MAG: hypothetical protein ABSG65_27855, partial [Bryobacteraceae bacterium]